MARVQRFLATEVAGGVALVAAAVVALVWANSPWSASYADLWTGGPRRWVNDGLMTVFFLVVALEVKRELVDGELRDRRRAALPVVAAVGGMAGPALVYLAVNAGGTGARGWGIPMATDIAFAVGVAAVVARNLPPGLRLFLLALAIVDDIGAIVVIAVFYSRAVAVGWLAGAVVVAVVVWLVARAGTSALAVYGALGVGLWIALHEAGVHPTLAGVVLGLVAPLAALEDRLHPWTSLGVVPVFALANAGVSLSTAALDNAVRSPVAWGVLAGLVVGKTVGITTFAWIATRTRIAALPVGATWRQLLGTAMLAGIGFTVSIFVTGLAFTRDDLAAEAKIGIVAAALVATAAAALVLHGAGSQEENDLT